MSDDYYKILEIAPTATPEEIQKAYRRLARKHHPDLNQDDPKGAKEKFQKVQDAYDVVGNPEKRKFYDQFGVSPDQAGSAGEHGPNQWSYGAGGPGGGPFRGGSTGGLNIDDILRMFGGGGGGSFERSGGMDDLFGGMGAETARRAPGRGSDLERNLSIPFIRSIQGGSVDLKIRRSTGQTETIAVKIPAGIVDGKKIRLSGLGNPGRDGGKSGNLLVTIRVEEHPFFTRRGDNLYVSVPVTLKEAVFGAKIDVPTPKGDVKLTVPAGSSSGTKLRIRGCGVPRDGKKDDAGDLFAELSVVLPKDWSDDDRKLLGQIGTEPPTVRGGLRW